MRYFSTFFCLCVALATSARAQSFSIDILPASPVPGDLSFNPTALGSAYPFRSLTSTPLATPAVGVGCYTNTNGVPVYSQGTIPDADSSANTPVDPACFKSFPQFFKPAQPLSNPSDDTYFLSVCKTGSPGSRFEVSAVFTSPQNLSTPNPDFPVSRLVYRTISSDVAGTAPGVASLPGHWTNASNVATSLFTSTFALESGNCATVKVQLRLRLDGSEAYLSNALSSSVTFAVAVFP